MNKVVYKILTFMITAMILTSCGDEQVFFQGVQPAPSGSIKVKFVHAAYDTTGVNFFLDEAQISSGTTVGTEFAPSVIAYAGIFPVTDYTAVTSANQVKVIVPDKKVAVVGGSPIQYLKKTMVTASVNGAADKYYTVAFLGVTGAYETVITEDAIGDLPLDGQSYIRFIHLLRNVPNNVNVVATPLSGDLTPITIASNVPFKGVVTFSAQIPRSYTIRVVDAITPTTIYATAIAANGILVGNKIYTMFARGRISGTGTQAPTLDRMINR